MLYTVEPVPPELRVRVENPVVVPLPPRLLAAIAVDYAAFAALDALAEPGPYERAAMRMHLGDTYDVWLIRWGPRSGTELHDHGGSAGALYVAAGALVEYRPARAGTNVPGRRDLETSTHRAMRADHVHEVVNEADVAATSVHAYSPPLTTMQHYRIDTGAQVRPTEREIVGLDTVGRLYAKNG